MSSAQALADIRATPSKSRSERAPERSFQSPHAERSQRGMVYSNASNQSQEVLMMCRRANSAVEALPSRKEHSLPLYLTVSSAI